MRCLVSRVVLTNELVAGGDSCSALLLIGPLSLKVLPSDAVLCDTENETRSEKPAMR